LTGFSQNLHAFNESETALKKVKELKADKDLLIVSGSIYLLGEVLSSYSH
jgi:folylpolyglutamate synthase/dihydropteroate synthase